MSSRTRAVQCFVAPEVHRALKTLAAQRDTTISAMVRTSLVETIHSAVPQPHEPPTKEDPQP